MVADILDIFIDTFSGLLTGLGNLMIDAFELLIYNPTTGLTDLASWTLVFGAVGIVVAVVNRFTRA
jgi:hypothetical protein